MAPALAPSAKPGPPPNRRTVERKCPLQEHYRTQDESLPRRLSAIQAVQGEEGQKSRDQQSLLHPQEGRKSINSICVVFFPPRVSRMRIVENAIIPSSVKFSFRF